MLVLLHPEELGSGETGESYVACKLGQLFPADFVVKVVNFSLCPAVVPEYCGSDDIVVFIKHDKTMHLAAGSYCRDFRDIDIRQKGLEGTAESIPPLQGILLAPARLREYQRVLLRSTLLDLPFLIHKQQFYCRRSEINTYVFLHTSILSSECTLNLSKFSVFE